MTGAYHREHGDRDWFEPLYRDAGAGAAEVPWDRAEPSQLLRQWAVRGDGTCCVVGCGYGRDAELMASLGWAVTAFDVSPTAIEEARRRHPDSPVSYETADLFDLPDGWAFDLVVESMNVHALPHELRAETCAAVASLVGPGGTLLALEAAGDGTEDGPPWPFTEAEMSWYARDLTVVELVPVTRDDGAAWWRGTFRR